MALKYPEGVKESEGEKWFYNDFIPEIIKEKDLLRCFSYKAIEPKTSPFVRVIEFCLMLGEKTGLKIHLK